MREGLTMFLPLLLDSFMIFAYTVFEVNIFRLQSTTLPICPPRSTHPESRKLIGIFSCISENFSSHLCYLEIDR
jgi:hypothetical protein